MKGDIKEILTPYAMYVGNANTRADAKLAAGAIEWASSKVSCTVSDTHNLFPEKASYKGSELNQVAKISKTLVIGYLPAGARLNAPLITVMLDAMKNGMDVAAALHDKINECPILVETAERYGRTLYDFRHHDTEYPLGNGNPRKGYRVLTIGTDCNCGKKYTSLAVQRALSKYTEHAKFCATGQTGFLISGYGINNDTVVADFLAGAAEYLSPDNADAIYVIEGQGAIRHPAYTGGSMSLIAGSQPDGFILCHTVGRGTMRKTNRSIDLDLELTANRACASMHGWDPELLGISLNYTESSMTDDEKRAYENELSAKYGVFVFDPSVDTSVLDDLAFHVTNEAKYKNG